MSLLKERLCHFLLTLATDDSIINMICIWTIEKVKMEFSTSMQALFILSVLWDVFKIEFWFDTFSWGIQFRDSLYTPYIYSLWYTPAPGTIPMDEKEWCGHELAFDHLSLAVVIHIAM